MFALPQEVKRGHQSAKVPARLRSWTIRLCLRPHKRLFVHALTSSLVEGVCQGSHYWRKWWLSHTSRVYVRLYKVNLYFFGRFIVSNESVLIKVGLIGCTITKGKLR